MKKSILVLFLAASVGVFSSCESPEKVNEAGVVSLDSEKKKTEEMGTTEVSFKEMEHDFGTILEGEVVGHVFKFTNTGDKPLRILDAKASCGCTVPEWTKDPIAPGEEGKLEVKYNSSGKSGVIDKTVTVTANTDPAETVLHVKANVRKLDSSAGPVRN
ncbi:DUF1573 domain-containing protein [Cytophagaceae bacterium ABcell3]|nr:DUF1573 domain-containing protein [Cytophagaceae bacterium ABcell3]